MHVHVHMHPCAHTHMLTQPPLHGSSTSCHWAMPKKAGISLAWRVAGSQTGALPEGSRGDSIPATPPHMPRGLRKSSVFPSGQQDPVSSHELGVRRGSRKAHIETTPPRFLCKAGEAALAQRCTPQPHSKPPSQSPPVPCHPQPPALHSQLLEKLALLSPLGEHRMWCLLSSSTPLKCGWRGSLSLLAPSPQREDWQGWGHLPKL